jgi:heme/copper-type cytochrome/quinol oxidase subunit 2
MAGLTWDLGYLIVIAALFATVMFMTYEKFCRSDDARCKGITMTFGVLAGIVALIVVGIAIYNARKGASRTTRPTGSAPVMPMRPTGYPIPELARPMGYYRPT